MNTIENKAMIMGINATLSRLENKIKKLRRRMEILTAQKKNLETALDKDNPSTSTRHFDVV